MIAQSLFDFDRELLLLLNGSDSAVMDNFMFVLTSGATWIPLYAVLMYIVVKNNETMSQILLVVGCSALCVFLADGVADFIAKPYFQRWRPSNDPMLKYTIAIVEGVRGSDYGFFSAHAANTFSLALFFSLLVRSRLMTTLMVGWSLLNCYTRMYLGLHYPGDILCGLLWGSIAGAIAYLVYVKVYYRISPHIKYISSQYTSSGYNLSDINTVVLTFLLILIYALFRALIMV